MTPLASLLLLAAAQAPSPGAEARGAARTLFEQLLVEDEDVYHERDRLGGEQVTIATRPRASDRHGICQLDRLEIERDPGGAIRKLETTHRFLIVTGRDDKPRWDLAGEALEKSCAAAGGLDGWFGADEPFDAEAAVVALLALKQALLEPDRAAGLWGCRTRSHCPDPKAIAERIRPLNPEHVWDGDTAGLPCPEGKYCVAVTLQHTDCDSWITQLRLDRSGGFRLHSARAGRQLAVLHCGDPTMYP
jgi:hypothetical protein